MPRHDPNFTRQADGGTPLRFGLNDAFNAVQDYTDELIAALPDPTQGVIPWKVVPDATYTILAADLGSNLIFNNTGAITVTFPAESVTSLAIGSWVLLTQQAAGQITVVGGTGTTNLALRIPPGMQAKTRGQYSDIQLRKVGSVNSINLTGDLALA